MVRSAAGKVMWVGRATVFLVGLAVILALVLGVATSAMGANGNPFLLGKKNVATAISTLVKQGTGPALKLQVGAGQPPLAVNSKARVANLNAQFAGRAESAARADNATNAGNANTLDGKDSTEFLGKTETATNADQLDGVDSAAFWRGNTYTLSKSVSGTANGTTQANHTCNSGDKLLSGGYAMSGTGFEVYVDAAAYDRYHLYWRSGATANNAELYVYCADF